MGGKLGKEKPYEVHKVRDETELSRWSEDSERASVSVLSDTWLADRREVSRVPTMHYIFWTKENVLKLDEIRSDTNNKGFT